MKHNAHKIGAIFYLLWGILHVIGGGALLQASIQGAAPVLVIIGSATPAAQIPQIPGPLTVSILAYYAWILVSVGIIVAGTAVLLNWKNSRPGYWFNLAVVSTVDIGLILMLLAPGHMALSDGMMGVSLWIPAVVFSTIGLLAQSVHPRPQGVMS